MIDLKAVNKSWTLFLDRDGVINIEKEGSYIFNQNEFIFYDNTLLALALLSKFFGRIFIVTNQRGVGKKLMTLDDLHAIHQYMQSQIELANGKVDQIFFCTDIEEDSENRKPNPGMAFQAKKQFPETDFLKSIMVGNKLSDMQFGRNAGMKTVFVATTHPETPYPHENIDLRCNDLLDFATAILKIKT